MLNTGEQKMENKQNKKKIKKSKDNCVKFKRTEKTGKGRLSKQTLYNLRNSISIKNLIINELGLQNHMDSGVFRFECPLCSSFHTSIMKNKNLARCFDCEINFNTIDMVMEVRKTGFRQSTDFLISFLERMPEGKADSGKTSKPVKINNIISKSNLSGSQPEQEISHVRIESMKKDINDLKYRIDQLQKFVINEFSGKRN